MKNLHNPKWLLLINTLPMAVLFFLMYGQFTIIQSLLNEEKVQLWISLGLWFGLLGFSNLFYAVYLIAKKQLVSVWYGLIALVLHIGFIYFYSINLDDIIPFSIPQWMISHDIYLYVGTFLMPTLAYSLFILMVRFTPEHKSTKAWINFAIALSVPVSFYLFVEIILPLWRNFLDSFSVHFFVVIIIVSTLVFLFFLIRGVFIIGIRNASTFQKHDLIWKIPLTIVLPILGLLINNGVLTNPYELIEHGIFGNFNNPWFYILTLTNGILICMPNTSHKKYRLLLFLGRSVTFSNTVYFFLVLLPFLPFSVIAIIVFGAGILMIIPVVLFLIQSQILQKDFNFLQAYFSKKLLRGVAILGFLSIPICITTIYLRDKSILNETLAYLYTPDYSEACTIDVESLENTLQFIKIQKDRNNDLLGFSGNKIPYLSSYYNWLVLDNLTLSDAKISRIEEVFFGIKSYRIQHDNIVNDSVRISHISSKSTYVKEQKIWKSWVDLEITNHNKDQWFAEYATTLKLPEGCWISDYYLFVGNKKEPGILAEKKSAMWIFSQIRNENRDPGILYYLTGNRVAFRVFPFSNGEIRKTGIEFIHKEPISLKFDEHQVLLGNQEESIDEKSENEYVAYVSTQEKKKLKSVQRQPYFHFLVDASKNKQNNVEDFSRRIETVLNNEKSLEVNSKISFVNRSVKTLSLEKDWKATYKKQTFEGGFFLDRAIRTALIEVYQNPTKTYPVFVVLTDSIQHAIVDKDFSDLQFTFPENDLFYFVNKNGQLRAHSLANNPLMEIPTKLKECEFCETVLAYPLPNQSVVYLPNNEQPNVVLKESKIKISGNEIQEKDWMSALTMQGHWNSQLLHPETSDEAWLSLVRNSFKSKIMTPVTSYLVVENEAQKEVLKKKQAQVLSGNKSLDLGEEAERMSEPSWIVVMILLSLIVWFRAKKRKKQFE